MIIPQILWRDIVSGLVSGNWNHGIRGTRCDVELLLFMKNSNRLVEGMICDGHLVSSNLPEYGDNPSGDNKMFQHVVSNLNLLYLYCAPRSYFTSIGSYMFSLVSEYGTAEQLAEIDRTHINDGEDPCIHHGFKSIIFAIKGGRADNIKYIHEHYPNRRLAPTDYIEASKKFDIFKLLITLYPPDADISSFIFCNIAGDGLLDVLRWLSETYPDIRGDDRAVNWASEYGHLKVLQYLHDNHPYIHGTDAAIDFAAAGGYDDVLEYLSHNYPELEGTNIAFDHAAQMGHGHTLFALERLYPHIRGTRRAFEWSASEGRNDVLLTFRDHFGYVERTSNAYTYAAECGRNDTILFLNREFPELQITRHAYKAAVDNTQTSTVELLRREFPQICPDDDTRK